MQEFAHPLRGALQRCVAIAGFHEHIADAALKAYKLVDIASPDTQSWPFRAQLEERIKNLDANIAAASSAPEDDDLAYAWKLGTGATCASCYRR